MTNEARLRSDEALSSGEVGELRNLAKRVANYLSTNNHNDFENIYLRFSELLARWRGGPPSTIAGTCFTSNTLTRNTD